MSNSTSFFRAVLVAAIFGMLARDQYKDHLFMLIIGLCVGFNYFGKKDKI